MAILTSPKGVAVWPKLVKPDTKFKDLGEWQIKLRVPAKEASALVEAIDQKHVEWLASLKERGEKRVSRKADKPYKVDEESGDIVFSFKRTAAFRGKDGAIQRQSPPRVVDSKNKPVVKPVWSGSICKVAFSINGWFFQGGAGVRLGFEAVQVLTLVTGDTFGGFEEEEGYEETAEPTEFSEESGVAGSASTSTDF